MPVTAAVLVAADGDFPDIPGQPYVSPDDLASIGPLWQQAVQQQLVPVVAEVYQTSAGVVHAQMVDATQVPTLPSVGSLAAEQYLAQATNTFAEVGDDLWATARSELLDGFEKGESIDQLAARLRASAGMTAKKATLVARTQVLDASNAGSIATARAAGIDMQKEWMSAEDLRVRPEHVLANGQKVDLNAKFTVGGYECDRPHDPTLPPALRYSCRCTTGYLIPEAAVDEAVDDARPVPPIPGTSGVDEPLPDPYAGDLVSPALPGPQVGIPAVPGGGLTVRPALKTARTTTSVGKVFATEYRRITGRDIDPNSLYFEGSVATAREHAEGVLRGLERFPDIPLERVVAFGTGNEYASATSRAIRFNQVWTSPADRKKYLDALAQDEASRWHVPGSGNPVAVALHEFGHVVDTSSDLFKRDLDALLARSAAARDADLATARAAGEMVDADDFAAGGGVDGLIRRDVSRYATRDRKELAAEAFADVMINGDRASDLSRDIFTLLEAEYRRGGGVIRPGPDVVLPSLPGPATPETLLTIEQHIARINQVTSRAPRAMRQRIKEELERQAEIAPEAVAAVRSIRIATQSEWDDLVRRGVSTERTRAMRFEHDIIFSPEWQTDRRAIDRAHRFDYENNQLAWSFPGYEFKNLDVAAGVLRHELGHTVASRWPGREILSRDREFTVGGQWTVAQRQRLLHPLADELKVRHPRPDEDIADWFNDSEVQRAVTSRISQYAAKDLDEALGEIWAVFSGRGVEATALARRIGTIMRAEWLPDRLGAQLVAVPGSTPAVSLTSRTVAQLRALAQERGITIPAGSKKADIMRLLDEGQPRAVAGPVADAAGYAARQADLRRFIPVTRTRRLPGGKTGKTELLEHADGTKRVRKTYDLQTSQGPGIEIADAEELGALVMRAVGARAPAVVRTGERGILEEFVEGRSGKKLGATFDDIPAEFRDSPEGRRIGLADAVMGNGDRAPDNWFLIGDDLVGIDQGGAFRPSEFAGSTSGFTRYLFGEPGQFGRATSWRATIDIDPLMLAEARQQLTALRGEFERLGHVDWYDQMIVRLGEIEHRAVAVPTPAPVAAVEVPLAKRTVAQLRALAAERKITVPKGAKKPDIVRLLETPTAAPAPTAARLLTPAEFDARLGAAAAGDDALRIASVDLRTAAERKAYEDYVSQFRFVNTVLRENAGEIPAGRALALERRLAAGLDSAMKRADLPEDIFVYRVGGTVEFEGGIPTVGAEWTDFGFVSTSSRHKVPARGEVDMRILVPRGTRAVATSELDVNEVLLDRGTRFRVVRVSDPDALGVRRLDVEVVPPPAVAPVPAVDLAAERAALRTLARETNTLIEQTSATARVLAEVDELLAKKASAATIREAIADALAEPGQLFAGADPEVLSALRAVASDAVKLRAAVTRLGGKAKIKPVSKAGAKVTFDADTMEGVGGIDIPAGARVTVVRRGSTVTLPDGTVMQLEKARVTPVAVPVKKAAAPKKTPAAAVKKAPAKKAPAVKVGPASVRQPGVDLSDQVTPNARWMRQAELRQSFGDPTDVVLTSIVRQQPGWSDPGRVVAKVELDRAVRSGWVEMWRGVQDYPAGARAADIARATRTGDWDMGNGIYGNGVYTTVRRTTAEIYRGNVPSFTEMQTAGQGAWGPAPLYEYLLELRPGPTGQGGLIRMALDPNAKLIDYKDLKQEHLAFLRSIDFTGLQDTAYKRSLYDANFYAVMRGYDGVRVHGPMTNDGAPYPPGVANVDEPPQFVIFNRTVLIFERASQRYDS